MHNFNSLIYQMAPLDQSSELGSSVSRLHCNQI